MDFKFIVLLIVLILGLAWPQVGLAQQYIDIDLSPPKPKQQPKKQTPPSVKKSALKSPPKPAQKSVAPIQKVAPKKSVAKPKQLPQPPAPKPAPVIVKKPAPVQKSITTTPLAPAPTQQPIATPITRPSAPTAPPPIPKPEAPPAAAAQSTAEVINEPVSRFKNRHGFTVDYTTWYETMKLTHVASRSLVEGTSHYFGVSFNYDFTVYRENWGYALTAGAVTGNAQAGTKDSGDYYERRIVWTGFRGGGRIFWRANNRIDLGLGFLAQSKSTKWPEEENYVVVPQANPHYFYYIDTRWRLNYRYELVQSFGTHLRSYALAWMLGITYTLN